MRVSPSSIRTSNKKSKRQITVNALVSPLATNEDKGNWMEDAGSNPVQGSRITGSSSVGRAGRLGRSGRRFEPCLPDHYRVYTLGTQLGARPVCGTGASGFESRPSDHFNKFHIGIVLMASTTVSKTGSQGSNPCTGANSAVVAG